MISDRAALAEQAEECAPRNDRKVLNGIFGACELGRPGPTFLNVMDRPRPATTVSFGGGKLVFGIRFSMPSPRLTMRSANGRLVFDPRPPARSKTSKKGPRKDEDTASGDLPRTRCMGRSRGGLAMKIHALVDVNGNPIALKLTEGQAHDGKSAAGMLDNIGAGQTPRRPRLRQRRFAQDFGRTCCMGDVKPMQRRVNASLKLLPLPLPQPRRALLQQAQAFQGPRHTL